MDLLSIVQTIWRHKVATIPVIVLTLAGAYYVLAVKAPTYEAQASYVLINPPAPPTTDQIARDPALGKIRTDNPYTRFGDQSVIVDVLSRTLGSDQTRQALVDRGADSRYVVQGSAAFGFSSPIVQVTGVGPSPAVALTTARLVSTAVRSELDRMQALQHTDPGYRIKPLAIDVPDRAQLRASGKIRALVGVIALGVILMFLVVSTMNGFSDWRERRRRPVLGLRSGHRDGGGDGDGPEKAGELIEVGVAHRARS